MRYSDKPGTPEELVLQHVGVKGMKWGVRKASQVGSATAARKQRKFEQHKQGLAKKNERRKEAVKSVVNMKKERHQAFKESSPSHKKKVYGTLATAATVAVGAVVAKKVLEKHLNTKFSQLEELWQPVTQGG